MDDLQIALLRVAWVHPPVQLAFNYSPFSFESNIGSYIHNHIQALMHGYIAVVETATFHLQKSLQKWHINLLIYMFM